MGSKHIVLVIVILSVISKSNVIAKHAEAPKSHSSKEHAPKAHTSKEHTPSKEHAQKEHPSKAHSKGHAPAPSSVDVGKQEDQVLNSMRAYWKKMFGNLEMPPPINTSVAQPPPKKVIEALDSIAKREDNKTAGKGNRVDTKSEATLEKEFQASASSGKLDPKVEEEMAKRLAGMFSGPNGPDQKSVEEMKKLIHTVMSNAHAKSSSTASGDQPPLSPKEEERLKADIVNALGAKDSGLKQQLQRGEFGATMKAMGYGGEHAMSTILAVMKGYGPPGVDVKVHEKSVETLFFPAQELNPGQKMKLQFRKSTNNGAFLSSIKEDRGGIMSAVLLMDLVAILGKAADKKEDPSLTSEMDTVVMCEQPATKGKNKEKTCAMDLESMVNYTMAKIGKDVRPASTWVTKDASSPSEYTISTIKKLPAITTVGCCKMGFPFATFYCQTLPKSVNYILSLVGHDGSSLKAPVICHEDTSSWNPHSWVFGMLKTKPGDSKICHFLGADDVAWMPKSQENVAA